MSLTVSKLKFHTEVDSDGELAMETEVGGQYIDVYDAIEIIEYLKEVFEI